MDGEVTAFTANGCKTGDREFQLDVIICATGFDTSYRPRFPIRGRNGVNLQDAWGKQVDVYMGIAAAGFPNMFYFLGPHSPIGNGPVLSAIGTQTSSILDSCADNRNPQKHKLTTCSNCSTDTRQRTSNHSHPRPKPSKISCRIREHLCNGPCGLTNVDQATKITASTIAPHTCGLAARFTIKRP